MHFHAVVTVRFHEPLEQQGGIKPILGYLVVVGANAKDFSDAAAMAQVAGIQAYDAKAEELTVEQIDLTRIEANQWEATIRSEIDVKKLNARGVYYVSSLIFLDTFESEAE